MACTFCQGEGALGCCPHCKDPAYQPKPNLKDRTKNHNVKSRFFKLLKKTKACKHVWVFEAPFLFQPDPQVPQCVIIVTKCNKCGLSHSHPNWIEDWEEVNESD